MQQPHSYNGGYAPAPAPTPAPTPSPAPAPTPAPTPSSHVFDHYGKDKGGNGGNGGDGDDVDPEMEAEECKEKLATLDASIDEIDATCRGQAINVASLTIMTNDQKAYEMVDIRRNIKTDADMIAFLK